MSKMIPIKFVSLQTAENDLPAYIDAAEIICISVWRIGDEVGPNMHRKMRGKTLVTLMTKAGTMNWTEEGFDEVSAKILEARGQTADAKTHKELADGAKLEKSRFAV